MGSVYDSYGGEVWYDMAKALCCNFKVRQAEGKCVTMAAPYVLFEKPCSDCPLGRELINKMEAK